jgi:phage terminase small subunit
LLVMARPKGVKDFEQGQTVVPDPEASSLGPAMLALNAAQRRFAIAAVMFPLAKDWQIAKAAGYSDFSHGGLRVCAHRLFHDEKVLAAIKECADKEIRGSAMLGIATIKKIVRNDLHKDQLKAAQTLVGLAGFTIDQNINLNQNITDQSGKAIMEEIGRLASKLGVPLPKLLGQKEAAPVVDAEFSEVGGE